MSTYSAKSQDTVNHWVHMDASDRRLGRLATTLAHRLRGKHRAVFTPHVDTGDFIVVTNTDHMVVTGRKLSDKMYYRHSGYPGGIKSQNLADMMSKDSTRVLYLAVKGMLPRGPLGRSMLKKLKIYAGKEHPHAAQQPLTIED